ncbi:MAG: RelA/SpoT family protein [Dysgonamonadaceae bacterium]|jgi:GTP pyrophosphokinase|nr:RelA/SpoT family protein [Dysgonamonadaceae bacterium]
MREEEKTMLQDEIIVQKAYDNLVKTYVQSNHRGKFEIIDKAYKLANKAHKGVKREDGLPYITHPIAVAQIVCEEIGLGSTSICAALLHDVVEDADYTVSDIEELFGKKIAEIVDGLTKIPDEFSTGSVQADTMRKLIFTMASDIRVILVKLADRLHNMRTLGICSPAKKYRISGETMFLYAPLAHRLGLNAIKSELEDLCFKYEHPNEYTYMKKKLEVTAGNRETIYEHFASPLYPKLNELGIEYKMQERVKSIRSIWDKMQIKKVGFEDVYDIFAVRIIFKPLPDLDVKKQCWDIYSAITDLYKLKPDRIRDFVSQPKANGYQALHMTVMGPDGQWIEVQIRSEQMDDVAEKGLAAHWKYKAYRESGNPDEEPAELEKWLATIKDILEDPNPDSLDFLDTIKLNLYASEIFAFTPKGDIRTLPQGASALDFAYEIHSNVGDRCIGAKVNHQLVPLSYKLNSGDQVEIITSRSQLPQPEWLHYVVSVKAKTKIELSLKRQKKEKASEGEKIIEEFLRKAEIEPTQQIIDKIIFLFDFRKKEDFYYAVAAHQIELPENLQKILKEKTGFFGYLKKFIRMSGSSKNKTLKEEISETSETPIKLKYDRKKTYILEEEDIQKKYLLSKCCNPIPGDKVLGYARIDGLLEIHKIQCEKALRMKAQDGKNIISCEWAGHKALSLPGKIELSGIDRIGIMSDIVKIITKDMSVNMRRLMIDTNDEMFNGKIEVIIHDVDDINNMVYRLSKVKGMQDVKRVE